MGIEPWQLIVVGCNHQSTPLEIREKIALSSEGVDQLRGLLAADGAFRESLILNTCNRLELYLVTSMDFEPGMVLKHLCQLRGFAGEQFRQYIYCHSDRQAVEHAFQVAAGLDSQIVGETEILGQMKSAYQAARESDTIGSVLHRLFQKAFQSAKWVRTHTGISTGQVSLGNIAVELATRIFGRLTVARTLVVGSGEVGGDVARAFRSRGVACISIASRTADRAETLARSIDGLIIPFQSWQAHLPYVDIAIFATSSPELILHKREVESVARQRPNRPIFLIDLAVPRDVETSVAELGSVYLYNYDDLADIANENLRNRAAELQFCREHLTSRAERTWQRVK